MIYGALVLHFRGGWLAPADLGHVVHLSTVLAVSVKCRTLVTTDSGWGVATVDQERESAQLAV